MFLQQRKRRAFAFVLNKWDRCLHAGRAGLRPDEDMLRKTWSDEGFQTPLLFRTCARIWVDLRGGARERPEPPEGEQFATGALAGNGADPAGDRGDQGARRQSVAGPLRTALREAAPPDLAEAAERVKAAWAKPLGEEATATADVLVNTLEPYQKEIEHHFALEGQQRFRGLMACYLHWSRASATPAARWRRAFPFVSRVEAARCETPRRLGPDDVHARLQRGGRQPRSSTPAARRWSTACSSRPTPRAIPLSLLTEPVEALAKHRLAAAARAGLTEVFDQVEKHWTRPKGFRRVVQGRSSSWRTGCRRWRCWRRWPTCSIASSTRGTATRARPDIGWVDVFLPFLVLLAVLVILQMLIIFLLPLRWGAIRGGVSSATGGARSHGT